MSAAILPELDNTDWEEVFKYGEPTAVIGDAVSTAPFDRADVSRIIAMEDGENDGATWLGVFALADGRFVSIEAGCDYTGWG